MLLLKGNLVLAVCLAVLGCKDLDSYSSGAQVLEPKNPQAD